MYSSFRLIWKYARYYLLASNSKGHGIHSPFVFDFILRVLNDKTIYPDHARIEKVRNALLKENTLLAITDFGAGSGHNNSNQRKVSEIAQHALKSPKYASLLFRIVKHYGAKNIVELGTSLGVTSCYLAMASPGVQLVTLEGSEAIAARAKLVFSTLQPHNIIQVTGNFDDTFPTVLNEMRQPDLAFLDGNHRLEPTVRYFEQLIPFLHDKSIVILDDIHWSAEMEKAWEHCRKHSSVTLSIDLFFVGILFFSKDFRVPQHFVIRF